MKKLTQKTRHKIWDLTNWNDHVGARILLAKELGFNWFAQQFKEHKDSYDKTEELSQKLFSVVFKEDPDLQSLF